MGSPRLKWADYKAPGGKLVRVRLKEEGGQIRSVQISGDFFLVPEEDLSNLEKALQGILFGEAEVKRTVEQFFESTGAQGVGVSADDFVKALLAAKEGA